MERYLVILEYVKTLAVWPVAIVAIVFVLRQPLIGLIDRMVSVCVPGVQLDTRQQTELAPTKPAPETPPPQLPANVLQLAPHQQEELRKVFQAERAAARFWE